MSELDLLNLSRSITENELSLFTQIIMINFATIVAIYYFLNRAIWQMKVFSYVAYLCGMFLFFGQMLFESITKVGALDALRALKHSTTLTQQYLELHNSWLSNVNIVLVNGTFWLLVLGVLYLLFFWKRPTVD